MNYQQFNEEKSKCRKCLVGTYYNKVVSSVGNIINPTYMIIGEAPGEKEVEKGQPFCGPAGKILREELIKNQLTMENTVITNTLPCRPYQNQFPTDRNLVATCISMWLRQEIEILKPKYVLLVGSTPMKYVLGTNGPISDIRGRVFGHLDFVAIDGDDTFLDKYNYTVTTMVTFHPSYILRNGTGEAGMFVRNLFNQDIQKFKNLILNQNPLF